jgi:DNA-directed RNA polymerase specialized sigma54-like protein
MRTKQEIENEIAALKALKPVGRFAAKTAESIELQIEELEYGVDQTAGEWEELTGEQQSVVNDTIEWKEGHSKNAPSKEWDGLVEPNP